MITKWDLRWLDMAKFVSTWSKDPSTQVGAVIARGKKLVSLGYNGFPEGEDDNPELYADRTYKYAHIVHGEINAVRQAEALMGDETLYTVPFMPCSVCAEKIIATGIKRVVAPYSDNPRWVDSFVVSKHKFELARVELVLVGEPK